jgi:molybdenum cofactor cytidylyltransferase
MRAFAIIPAAGRSRRMGQPKLLLPWGTATVIEHVLAAWQASRVERVIAVVHPDDDALAVRCLGAGAVVVRPHDPPPEMKDSVLWGLKRLEDFGLAADDAWLVAPADMPGLVPATIDRVIEAYEADASEPRRTARIYVPLHGARRGHPILFPWALSAEVARLGEHEGLNALVARHETRIVDAGDLPEADDFDTPPDYDRLRGELEE